MGEVILIYLLIAFAPFLVDFHQSVGALADNKQLSIRGFDRSYKLFLTEAEQAGVSFTEEELARISDFKLFKRLYKCC